MSKAPCQKRLKVGDVVRLAFGPFACTGRVVKVTEHGSLVDVNNDATLVGYERLLAAPNGTQLTDTPNQTWIGRAHEPSTEVIP